MHPTQAHLISKATELFLGRGYGMVGTAELCRAAGVNKGTFYHFFPSKAALVAAAIGAYGDDFTAEFEAIAQSNSAPSNKIIALFKVPECANQAWKEKHGYAQGCLVGNMTLELGDDEPAVREATLEALGKWKTAISPILLEFRVGQGIMVQPPDLHLETDADRMMALIQGGLLLAKAYNAPEQIGAMASVALAMMATSPTI